MTNNTPQPAQPPPPEPGRLQAQLIQLLNQGPAPAAVAPASGASDPPWGGGQAWSGPASGWPGTGTAIHSLLTAVTIHAPLGGCGRLTAANVSLHRFPRRLLAGLDGRVMTPVGPDPASPAAWLVLDFKRAADRPEEVQAQLRHGWTPDLRGTEETTARRPKKRLSKRRERALLIPSAPVVALAVQAPGLLLAFQPLHAEPPEGRRLGPAVVRDFGEPGPMPAGPDTLRVSHNVAAYDLPRLRLASSHAGLQLSAVAADEQTPVFGTWRVFPRGFDSELTALPSPKEVAGLLGLASHKRASVPLPHPPPWSRRGRVDEVLSDNCLDVGVETEPFLRLTRQRALLR